jgi:hypothetical protein
LDEREDALGDGRRRVAEDQLLTCAERLDRWDEPLVLDVLGDLA